MTFKRKFNVSLIALSLSAAFPAFAGPNQGTGNDLCPVGTPDTIYGDTNTCNASNPADQPSIVFGNNNRLGGTGGLGIALPSNFVFGDYNRADSGIAIGIMNQVSGQGLAIGYGNVYGGTYGARSNGGIAIMSGSNRVAQQGEIYMGYVDNAYLPYAMPSTFSGIALTSQGAYINGGGVQMNLTPTGTNGAGVTAAVLNLQQGQGITRVTGIADPQGDTDAANKRYVDQVAAGGAADPLALKYSDATRGTVTLSNTQVKGARDATDDTDLATWGQTKGYAQTYTDGQITSVRNYADGITNTAYQNSRNYTDSVAVNTYNQSRTYTDNAIANLPPATGGITQAQLDSAVNNAITVSQNYTNTSSATTLTNANAYTDYAISNLPPATGGGVSQGYVDAGDAATLAASTAYTDTKSQQAKDQAVAESKTYTDQVGASTLQAANQFTTDEIAKLNLNGASENYVRSEVDRGVKQSKDYTDQKFKEAKKYSYSAAALGMASSSVVFNPLAARQFGMAASTVNGRQAIAAGAAWQVGKSSIINVKAGFAPGMGGAAVGFTSAF